MLIQVTNNFEIFAEDVPGENGGKVMAIIGREKDDVVQIGTFNVNHDMAFEVYDIFEILVWIGDEVYGRMVESECSHRDVTEYIRDCADEYLRSRMITSAQRILKECPEKAGIEFPELSE